MSKNKHNHRAAQGSTGKPEISTAEVDIDTAELDLMTDDPDMATPEEQAPVVRDQDSGDDEASGEDPEDCSLKPEVSARPVVPWHGMIEPHTCPHCNWRILLDRRTKACIVAGTRAAVPTGDGKHQKDREMKCLHCEKTFIAREIL